tara:strand:- start:1641 stop:2039 length:399 start_codon:yes stop_codon:yes gene_type:complete
MDLNLEKVMMAKEILLVLKNHIGKCVVINVITEHKEVADFISHEVKSVVSNAVVKNDQEQVTLSKLLNSVRDEIEREDNLLLINVSHDLGWPSLEVCAIDLNIVKDLNDREAVYAGESVVINGKPFYDDEIL